MNKDEARFGSIIDVVSIIFSVAFILVLANQIFTSNIDINLAIVLLCFTGLMLVLILNLIIQFIYQKRYAYIEELLYNECDALRYFYQIRSIMEQDITRSQIVFLLHKYLLSIEVSGETWAIDGLQERYGRYTKHLKIMRLYMNYVIANSVEEKKEIYQKMYDSIYPKLIKKANHRLSDNKTNIIQQSIVIIEMEYNCFHHQFEKNVSKDVCINDFDSMFRKVQYSFSMGLSYYELKNYEAAIEHLSFVLKHGNTIYKVKMAEEMIEAMNEAIEATHSLIDVGTV